MIIKIYNNTNNIKLLISPKSKKIGVSCVEAMFDVKDTFNPGKIRRKPHRETNILSGFTFAEVSKEIGGFKHNKKRSKNRKYIG